MTYFPPVEFWDIPETAWAESIREMGRDGLFGNEGVALWLGRRGSGVAEITHVVALRGPEIIKRPDLLVIQPGLVNEVTDLAIDLGVALIGQIHSHGRNFGTDLSYADCTFGIKVPSFLSLVAPDYGLEPRTRLQDCGVHVFERNGVFRRLRTDEVNRRLRIVHTAQIPLFTVGED